MIGLFVMGSVMIGNLVGNVENSVTIQAFLSDDADSNAVQALQTKIEGWDDVESVKYKSKDEALEEYKQSMSNRNASDVVAALDGENPVPASYVITLKDPQKVEEVANKLIQDSDFQSVADGSDASSAVSYGRETVERLFSVTYYLRMGAIVLVVLLSFIAFVFINNTIRLSIAARRREIAIMRLVGASNGFIRGPFLTEGVLEALIGSLLAIGVLQAGSQVVLPKLQQSLSFLSFNLPTQVVAATYGALVVIGILLGLFGSAIAMRRYLRV